MIRVINVGDSERKTELPVSEMVLQDAKKVWDQWFSKFFHIPPLQTQTLSTLPLQKSQKTIAKISHYLDMVPGVFWRVTSG